ncbi:MAG: hypothetical protein MUC94_16075 [bacterium]|jgi:hypothetical protein|nr:hypothetical protein [bacterium]
MKVESISRFIKIVACFLFSNLIFYCHHNSCTPPDQQPVEAEVFKILFIGSSYFSYNNLPEMFNNLAEAGGKKVFIDTQIKNGTYLDYHSTNPATEQKINQAKWDYVLLQGVCTNCGYPETHQLIFPPYQAHPLKPALELLYQKIKANCESTKVVYCMPWAFEDGTLWLPGGTDTYFTMQKKIYDNAIKYADEIGLVIAPVGWAWNEVLKTKIKELHYLHLSDYNHPSIRGSYLTACVLYATIFQESAVNLAYYSSLPEDEAKYFQSVASEIVLKNSELWHIKMEGKYHENSKASN